MCDYEVGVGVLESRQGIARKFNADVNYTGGYCAHPTNPSRIIDIDTDDTGRVGYFDFKTGTRGYYASGAHPTGLISNKARPLGFEKKVFFFFEGDAPIVFDGTTTAAVGFTGPTLTNLVGGATFKGHIWVFEHQSQSAWFHPTLAGINGALTEFPMARLTTDNGVLMCAFRFTLSSGLQTQSLFCFVFDTGEVFTYAGDYPGGTAGWNLVGSAKIGAPLGYQSIIEADGDVMVLTRSGVVSIRDLFSVAGGDSMAASKTVEIDKYWQQLIRGIEALDPATTYDPRTALLSNINGAYHQTLKRVVIFAPRFLRPTVVTDGELGFEIETAKKVTSALVFDKSASAWYVIKLPEFNEINHTMVISSYYSPRYDSIMFGTNDVANESGYRLWEPGQYRDRIDSSRYRAIEPELRGAIVSSKQNLKCSGVLLGHSAQAAIKGLVECRLQTEFGRYVSEAATKPSEDGVSIDTFNVGAESKSIQAILTLPAPDDGTMTKPHQIIDISMLLEQGGTLG